MAEWRLGRGWSEEELALRLRELEERASTTPERYDDMTRGRGWRELRSQALVAREAPGPPLPGGPFERAWDGITRYAFSDPRIVTVHFDPRAPLVGRRLLLEVRVLGLHYLCGVVIRETRNEGAKPAGPDGAVARGFRYDTLEGHLERGAEWFLLEKDPESGEIRFRIHARFRPGQFPNWWSRLGFALLARRYQRLWHRRAHHRLSVLAAAPEETRRRRWGRLAHEGVEVAFASWSGADERRRLPVLPTAAALGAITGVRSLAGLATLTAGRGRTGAAAGESRLERLLADPVASGLVQWAAAGEMVADKLPAIPVRTEPVPLAGRIGLGALAGVLVARRRAGPALAAAVVGAAVAAASTVAVTGLRRRLAARGLPDLALGLAEDAAVGAARRALRTSAR